jgi:outer membrane lipoprotein carrier protein
LARFLLTFILMLTAYWCALLFAALVGVGNDVTSVRHALEDRYHHARTLKAIFFERASDGSGGVIAASGTVYFSRPGRMRWEYESPQQKLFLVDGTNAWFYVPADHTASRAKMKESSDWRTPLALLVGKADLSEFCRKLDLVQPGGAEKPLSTGDSLLRCIARESSTQDSASYVLLEADPEARLVRVLIREPGNLETEFRFGNWEENVVIPEAKFHFQPPPGVAIVDEQSLAAQIR